MKEKVTRDGEIIPLPEKLHKRLEDLRQQYIQQVQAIEQQYRASVQLVVDGFVSTLDLPDDAQLEYDFQKQELRHAKKAS